MRRWIVTLSIGLAPFLVVGWLAHSKLSSPSTRSPVQATQRPTPTPAEADLPGGRLNADIRGQLAALPALRGPTLAAESLRNKVVLVTFFASWCAPCRVEMEHLKTAYELFADQGMEIVAVNLFEEFDNLSDNVRLRAYLDQLAPPFPVVEGNEAISQAFGKIRRIPTLMAYDRNGARAWSFVNTRGGTQRSIEFAELAEAIGTLL